MNKHWFMLTETEHISGPFSDSEANSYGYLEDSGYIEIIPIVWHFTRPEECGDNVDKNKHYLILNYRNSIRSVLGSHILNNINWVGEYSILAWAESPNVCFCKETEPLPCVCGNIPTWDKFYNKATDRFDQYKVFCMDCGRAGKRHEKKQDAFFSWNNDMRKLNDE